jgi:hypothetical protein
VAGRRQGTLKLRVELRQVIEPLVYEALKTPLSSYAEQHWRTADETLTSVAFRQRLAALAAEHFSKRSGEGRVREVIDRGTAKQLLIEVARNNSRYRSYVRTTSIHTEFTRLRRSRNNP